MMTSLTNIDELAVAANAFCSAHGIQVEQKKTDTTDGSSSSVYRSAPVSLLPNAYPKAAFDQAVEFATGFNRLVDLVSRDYQFLHQTLGGSVAAADPFTAKLLQLYREIYVDEKVPAALLADRFGIHRSDYMLHQKYQEMSYCIKQVELNTIAASFAGLSCQVAALHQYLVQRYDSPELREFLAINQKTISSVPKSNVGQDDVVVPGVPTNPTLERLPRAMHHVVERYQQRFVVPADQIAVLFVVQEGETNTVDQRLLEFRLYQNHGISVLRASLPTIQADANLSADGRLVLYGKEIALVYFRAGYAPSDYGNDDVAWRARATLERCRAAKCPSLGYHLAGTKKVQQALARPSVLERFIPNSTLREAFAGLYSLGDDMTEDDFDAVQQVLNGQFYRFVLKPQREGGGYNFYGRELLAKIRQNVTVSADGTLTLNKSLGEYILMERLFPPQQMAILMRNGKVEGSGESVSELGCFGIILADPEGTIIHNEYAGFLLRTKFSNVDEGGVASGFATLSSPYLC